ncbi:thiamine phosphate synthase, partial [Daejeonella sp.]|uniref:thiamine phosphate synthase n=1 Tax=Daejeonella sp. TaxID=2805397 RepID=UPI003782DD69
EDIQRVYASGVVDYIGCGPFAFTKTKANDYPLLGFEGYQEIVQKMQELQINIPLIGVGGIKLEDTEDLLNTGIDGLAVSAAVNLAENPGTIIKDFYKKIY